MSNIYRVKNLNAVGWGSLLANQYNIFTVIYKTITVLNRFKKLVLIFVMNVNAIKFNNTLLPHHYLITINCLRIFLRIRWEWTTLPCGYQILISTSREGDTSQFYQNHCYNPRLSSIWYESGFQKTFLTWKGYVTSKEDKTQDSSTHLLSSTLIQLLMHIKSEVKNVPGSVILVEFVYSKQR